MNEKQQRTKVREEAIIYVYQSLLLKKDIKAHLFNQLGNTISPYLYNLTIDVLSHKKEFIEEIEKNITNNWKFSRLGYIEQAILLVAHGELSFDLNDKSEIIFDAVEFSKKYCDKNTYKLINGILG